MTLHTLRLGPPDAPRVLLLHGGGTSSWSWREQHPALLGYRALIPDLPGHGRSPGPLRLTEAAGRLADLLEAEGGAARVVGLSIGSQLALTLLALRPDLVLGALLTGTLAVPIPGGMWLSGTPNRLLTALYWPVRNAAPLLALNRHELEVPTRYAADLAADTRNLPRQTYLEIMRENMAFRPSPLLARIPLPVTLLVGSREVEVLRRSARALVRLLPLARAYTVPGVNHLWPLSHPERFNAVLSAWLAGQAVPAGLEPLG
ncbi:alpha/beta fold hydrolase [Deinococcus sp.]|uniref:alpha/beta fold hydrolase n=1 Tax=Deinococcus sp. TaxID=47478 RepID=UPI003C7D88AC